MTVEGGHFHQHLAQLFAIRARQVHIQRQVRLFVLSAHQDSSLILRQLTARLHAVPVLRESTL